MAAPVALRFCSPRWLPPAPRFRSPRRLCGAPGAEERLRRRSAGTAPAQGGSGVARRAQLRRKVAPASGLSGVSGWSTPCLSPPRRSPVGRPRAGAHARECIGGERRAIDANCLPPLHLLLEPVCIATVALGEAKMDLPLPVGVHPPPTALPTMAAALPSPPRVLDGRVDMDPLTGEPGPEWAPIKCIQRKAYGCGEHGQEIVEGLKLYVRLGDSQVLTSSMAIRMNEAALRRIDVEPKLGGPDEDVLPSGEIQIVDQNLIVLMLLFQREYDHELVYHLIYDAVDASISLFKYLPDCHHVAWLKPVPERTSDGGYKLVLMVDYNIRVPGLGTGIYSLDLLRACSPGTRDVGIGMSLVKQGRFPWTVPDFFATDVTFSFKGKAFWADLSQGAVCCDLDTSQGYGNIEFICLPEECKLDPEDDDDDETMSMTRTMGCVGNSIWFVCIKRAESCANDLVTTWTLDLTHKKWIKEMEVYAETLWGLDSFKEAQLPEVQLECPVLTADEALCLVLPNQLSHISDYCPEEDIFCGFDMRLKNLLWHGFVRNYHISEPVILPPNFFPMLHKRKWNERDRH